MIWIKPLEFNMDISRKVYEDLSDNKLISTIQKIAIYSVIPLALIVFFEAVVKNMVCMNLANLGIYILNGAHDAFQPQDILA